MNKNGAFSNGASLPQLKTRRNAAGNFSSRRMLCHPLPSSCRGQADTRAEVKLDSEVANLHGCRLSSHSPVAVRTFRGKVLQPEVNKVGHSGPIGARPYNYSRLVEPQGCFSPKASFGRSDLLMAPGMYGAANQPSYHNMYPLKSKVEFGPPGMKGQAGWGVATLNDRLEEDVGRLLAELRFGTTAVDMN